MSFNISFNQLLEEQPNVKTVEEDGEEGEQVSKEVELTYFNQEVVDCFKDFIKYNTYLVHLDL